MIMWGQPPPAVRPGVARQLYVASGFASQSNSTSTECGEITQP
ncbi:hypothetical protein SBA1_760013 [Candidatus Sulfotelmatobacter kueseliae]|uniref:Uncharacterized protein n=1 Tax=Candidatus Sulfotelmatobacter kueseliae TaxID=2042962 RepID=A0A2U3L6U8_9BACT|nr:hypothetical protein SBA1_760013 [Candidatus Sulfotelmatobacter kueseliae]